jgi:hypothetical protein
MHCRSATCSAFHDLATEHQVRPNSETARDVLDVSHLAATVKDTILVERNGHVGSLKG